MVTLLSLACSPALPPAAERGWRAAETVPLPAGPGPDVPRAGPESSWPVLWIDEVAPANASLASDERGESDDWLELGGPDDARVSLEGWGLGEGDRPDWSFPAGIDLDPGERLVVWADGTPEQGPLHASFSLASAGEALRLFAPDGTVVDELAWPALDDDLVYGRFPGGGTNRAASIVATPGNRNPVDPGLSLDPSDGLFPPGGVLRLDLTLDREGHDALEVNRSAVVEAGLGFQGGFVSPIGLTIKGGYGSNRGIDEKCAFRLDLDEYVDGIRLRGQEHVTLNNMVQDPSTIHELLAWQLVRAAGVPGSRLAHVDLWMNGEFRGLYLNLETPDDQLLQRWFDDPRGNLYEGAYGVDLRDADVWRFEHDEQGPDDVTDRSDLQALVDFLEQPPREAVFAELEARVDLDRTLAALAVEAAIGHWDGYLYSANNYRLYHEPSTDRWTLLPWGLDQTFADFSDPYAARGLLAEFCFGVPSCRRRYDLALVEVAQLLAELRCEERVDEVMPEVRPLFVADPLRESSPGDLDRSVDDTLAFCRDRPADLLSRVNP